MKPTPLNFFANLLRIKCSKSPLIEGVAIDSRKVQSGYLFFALPGKKVDGHDFLKEVADKGAKAAVVQQDYQKESFGLELLRVPNVLSALQQLGKKVLEGRSCKVVAISGSVGKTTTKEFTREILKMKYKVAASPSSYNTESTLPLSILMADGDEDVLVLEMGMARPGEIAPLVEIAPPDIALLTTVAIQHATHFPDGLVGISREKASLFSHPKTKLALLHKDIDFYNEVVKVGSAPKINFSLETKSADYFLEFESPHEVSVTFDNQKHKLPYSLPMKVYALNLLAAITIARSLNVEWSQIAEAIPHLTLPPMRFERIEKEGIIFINDAYNANPNSMKAALENIPKPALPSGKKIAVLGEMNALGMYSEAGHLHIGEIALANADVLLCIGEKAEAMRKLWKRGKKEAHHFSNQEDLVACLKRIVNKGDVVLLKGARPFALEKILDHF